MKHLAVVTPCYNEEENVSELVERTKKVLAKLHRSYEHVIIDNGSEDKTLPLALALKRKNPHLRIISLSRNFGYQGAIQCGLDHFDAKYVVVMDGDLQDPPELIEKMYKELTRKKLEIVYAVKASRQGSKFKIMCYFIFYRLWKYVSEVKIPKDAGEFCIMTLSVAKIVAELPERTKFTRGVRAWVGFKAAGIEYNRPDRLHGESKFNFWKSFVFALDAIFPFSQAPARLALLFGLIYGVASVVIIVMMVVVYWFTDIFVPGYASIISLFLFSQSISFILLGIMGEYLVRIYQETQNRPRYLIQSEY